MPEPAMMDEIGDTELEDVWGGAYVDWVNMFLADRPVSKTATAVDTDEGSFLRSAR